MRYAILSLDIAKHTGWAFGEPDTEPEWGSIQFSAPDLGRRFSQYFDWLKDMVVRLDPTIITFEQPFIPKKGNLDTSRSLLMMCGLVEMIAHRIPLPVFEVPNATWKKSFIGHVRSDNIKADSIHKCAQHGWKVANDHEADALGVWVHSCQHFAGRATRVLGEAV